jgi:rod shape-determining protein MreB
MDVRGRNNITGLPNTITVSSTEMYEALQEPALAIVDAVHSVLERTPPELSSDISDRGIVMTGGGSLLYGIDKLVKQKTGINIIVPEDSISCVAYGTGKSLDNIEVLEKTMRDEDKSSKRN